MLGMKKGKGRKGGREGRGKEEGKKPEVENHTSSPKDIWDLSIFSAVFRNTLQICQHVASLIAAPIVRNCEGKPVVSSVVVIHYKTS